MEYVIVSVYRLSRIFLGRSRSWLRLRNARRVGALSGMRCTDRRITSGLPVIRPESMPSAEITSYKPTYRY
jgi:hypothetical protein